MSILIMGVDMPTSCGECPLSLNPHSPCWKNGGAVDWENRPNWCPLVPIPKHGRLIDADALLDDLLFPSKQFEQGMRELIGDAPTVIPAEED